MISLLRKVSRTDAGATAIEYSLIAGGVALVIIAATALIGGDVRAIFEGLGNSP